MKSNSDYRIGTFGDKEFENYYKKWKQQLEYARCKLEEIRRKRREDSTKV